MNKFVRFLTKKNKDSIAKAAVYYMICQLLVKGLSFITTPIFSRMLSKNEYGAVSNFFAWQSLLIPLVTLDLRVTINRSKYTYSDDNDAFISTILVTSNLVIFIFWFIVELNHNFFTEFFNMDMKYIRILFLYIVFQTVFDYHQIQCNIYHKYKVYVFYTLLSVSMSMILSIILILILDNRFEGRIYGAVFPMIALGFIIYVNILKKGKRIVLSYAKSAIRMAIPLIPSALSSTILSSSDRVMITSFLGNEQTALYSMAYSVSAIAGIIWTSLNQAWGPWFYDHLAKEKYDDIKCFSNKFIIIYSMIVVGIMLILPEAIYFMGGDTYMGTIDVMPPIILAMVFQFFYAFYFNVEYFYGETYIISLGTGIAAVANIILNFFMVPQFGYIAAAYTTLIGYAIMMIYHYLIVKYKLKKAYIYNNLFFGKIILILIVIQILISSMYKMIIMRYLIAVIYIVLIIGILYKYKAEIITKIKKDAGN